jgi:hypothetical protein
MNCLSRSAIRESAGRFVNAIKSADFREDQHRSPAPTGAQRPRAALRLASGTTPEKSGVSLTVIKE